MKENFDEQIEKEGVFGILPISTEKKQYGFLDAFLVLSGYCVATWSYTQGAYLTTLVGFKQLLIGTFLGAILMLAIYQLPVILSVRYGIDIWIWLKAVFGYNGVKIMTIIIIVINFPWYAVCADLFASSLGNILALGGIQTFGIWHTIFALLCVIIGTYIAYKGVGAITWTTRTLVPVLILVGALVIFIGFSSVPAKVIWNYKPNPIGYKNNIIPYVISIEANFAFVITLVGGMAEIPRLSKTERGGYWAGVLGQGLTGSFFVAIGAVMSIAMKYVTGVSVNDPALMLATLTIPVVSLLSLLLVGYANIGTQAVGSYIYAVMIKSSFPKLSYNLLLVILAGYVGVLCLWGRIIEYFGPFLTIGACIYAPLAALLFVDFFLVRKQKISLRSAYGLKGFNAYEYRNGINYIGFLCVIVGVFISIAIYNPVSGVINNEALFYLTPTGCSFIGTGALYWLLNKIPVVRKHTLRDREEITV